MRNRHVSYVPTFHLLYFAQLSAKGNHKIVSYSAQTQLLLPTTWPLAQSSPSEAGQPARPGRHATN